MSKKNATPPKNLHAIKSLDEYLKWVKKNSRKDKGEQKKNANKTKEFAFRGLGWHRITIKGFKNTPKCLWDVDEKNPKNKKNPKKKNKKNPKNDSKNNSENEALILIQWQKDLINEFTMAGYNDAKEKKHDLELLAKIQHIEPRTGFIDYSLNPLVALYFACEDEKINGLIITHDIRDIKKFNEVGPGNIDEKIEHFFNQDNIDKKIGDSFNQANKNLPWVWILPTANHSRMIAQQALFIFGKNIPTYDNYCIISKGNKKKIKEELKKQFSIDGNSLFPDFAGRAKYIATQKDKTQIYFNQANIFFQQGDYDKAIQLNPKFVEAYVGRGIKKGKNKKYDEAIEDFDMAIKLKRKYIPAHYNRGFANILLKKYPEAIKDYDNVIELNKEFAEAYYNRGGAKKSLAEEERKKGNEPRAQELEEGAKADFTKYEELRKKRLKF